MDGSPINVVQHTRVTDFGVTAADIRSSTISCNGRYICVRALTSQAQPSVIIIDAIRKAKLVFVASAPIDLAAVSATGHIIAIVVSGELQVHDLASRQCLRRSRIASWQAEPDTVTYLQWIDHTTVAIVTQTSIYHYDITNDDTTAPPERICGRTKFTMEYGTSSSVVTSLCMSPNQQWLAVTANQLADGEIQGQLQIHSIAAGASQPNITSPMATFGRAQLTDRRTPSTLFCFTAPTSDGPAYQLNVLELGVPRDAAYASATVLPLPDHDLPIAMHADNVACVLYIFTKRGLVTAHDLPSGKLLFAHKIGGASSTIIAASVTANSPPLPTLPSSGAGVIAIDGAGVVYQLLLDSRYVINYCKHILNDLSLASSIATRLATLPECKGLPTYAMVPLPGSSSATASSSSSAAPSTALVSADTETLRKVLDEKEHELSVAKNEVAVLRVEAKVATEDLLLAKRALKDAIARVPEAAKGPNAMGFYLHDDD